MPAHHRGVAADVVRVAMRIHEAREGLALEHALQVAKGVVRVGAITRVHEHVAGVVEKHDLVAIEPSAADEANGGGKVDHNPASS
jgi:hypothetical protein